MAKLIAREWARVHPPEVNLKVSEIGLAAAAVAFAVATAWRPGLVPIWLALLPLVVLTASHVAVVAYVVLMAHEGWRRWRRDRKGG
jgi:hypothetical protein